jgi:ribosomal protein S18 acetylase RimI-like enzyme
MKQERAAAIRRVEVRDLSAVETVARTTWPVAYAGIIPEEVQRRLLDSWYSSDSLKRAFAAQDSSFWVAEWRGIVVGFAQYVRRSMEAVELTRIYVLPDRQRGGVGAALLHAGLAAFADLGLTCLTVLVERENIIGRRFYERMGFTASKELIQELSGYSLTLVEYRRPIP